MEQEEVKKILVEMAGTRYGAALKIYLEGELDTIKDVTQYKTWKEAEGGQIGVRVIKRLFSFLNLESSSKKKQGSQYV